MPKIADVVQEMKQLRKELEEIRAGLRQSSMMRDEGLLNEKLKKWTNRVYEQLKAWGFKAEAEMDSDETRLHICTRVLMRELK